MATTNPISRGEGASPSHWRLEPQARGRGALATVMLLLVVTSLRAAPPKVQPVISGNERHIDYRADDKGNRVPDFSYAGYHAGDVGIPDVPVRVTVSPAAGDNTARIQSAIDYVASLPPDSRGAVLLLPGKFEINGGLWIKASGVVLRGSGIGENGTTLIAAGHDRRTLITLVGRPDRKIASSGIAIADKYVPVGATTIRLSTPDKFKAGDTILIRRPSTAEWIAQLRLTDMGNETGLSWKPGSRDFAWDRTVTKVDGDQITFDGPITTAIDSEMGGGSVVGYTWPGRISESGVENLRCESVFDSANPKDEAHSWMAITMEHVQDCWVRQVTMAHFAGSAVSLWETCKRITVEDCRSLDPISEIAGFRRHTFFTRGTQTLFARCWSENGRHDFGVGFCAPGPNAFVQCEAINALDDSGSLDSWASGVLFDNVRIDANAIFLGNRGHNFQFAGWSAANSMLWQCAASLFVNSSPAGAANWSAGCWGQFEGNGHWQSVNEFVHPVSLYYGQLAERLNKDVSDRSNWMMIPNDGSTSPTIEQAANSIAASKEPASQLAMWIDSASKRHAIPVDASGAKKIEELSAAASAKPQAAKTISVQNGWIAIGDTLPMGGRQDIMWWRGGIRPSDLDGNTPCLTRFVPGRTGWGLTDDLDELTDSMLGNRQVALTHHYALWYDRRDDDHERVRRMNGDCWPPFYDLPFLRSGQGTAWDGLSKYDLTKYNPWYWDRLKEFATLCDQKGLVLLHENFFQHNIIEAGAHWASCPWRSANNINNTGFPEPPPYAGDKRIFMAEQWYDETHPVRREIYRKYIRQCLDNFVGNSNVIQFTSGEFTGPLHFTQFWIDCIAEWEKDTGKKAIVGISATKDVQDAILADPVRSKIVNVIDINYWWYQTDGQPYAPQGGLNLAPRQFERVLKHRASSPDQVYRAVREYREKYPDKAVMYSADSEAGTGWAQLFAGGSLPQLRASLSPELQAAIVKMKPVDSDGPWMLSDGGQNYLIAGTNVPKSIDASAFNEHRIDGGRGQSAVWLSKK